MTSLGDDVSDNDVIDGELRRGAVRVTYTASGCYVSPVSPTLADDQLGLDRRRCDDGSTAQRLSRVLCCRKSDKVGSVPVRHRENDQGAKGWVTYKP